MKHFPQSIKYVIDASNADQGLIGNGKTIKAYVDAIGTSKKATIKVNHTSTGNETTYTLTTSETIPSNITLEIENGAILDGAGTLTINGAFKAGLSQAFGSNIGVVFGGFVGKLYGVWWNVTGDGVTDDTVALQRAINVASNSGIGSLYLLDGAFLIESNLDVKRNVDLIGNNEYIEFTDRDYWESCASRILLDSLATIELGNGAGLKSLLVYRSDMTFPVGGLTATEVALYAGTAVTIKSASPYIRHCTFLGFTRAITTDVTNTPRGRIEYVNIDCTNGIRIDLDLGAWTIENVYCQPILSNSDVDNIRTGIGFEFKNRSDWTTVIGCFAFNDTGFKVHDTNQIKFIGCGADHPADTSDTYLTGSSFVITGDSEDVFFLGCQAAAHNTGFNQNVSDGNTIYYTDCHIWGMNSAGFGYKIEGGNAFVQTGRIGAFYTDSGRGIYVDDVNSDVYVAGTHFVGLTTAIDTLNFSTFIADDSCVFENISSSIRTNELLPSVASAATLILPNNAQLIEVTGTVTIVTLVGSNRLPGETVTLLITDASGLIINDGTILLAGSGNATLTQNSSITLAYKTGNTWYEKSRSIR